MLFGFDKVKGYGSYPGEVFYYPFVFPIFNLGYRYQKPEGGFIFRANAGIISLGLSFGYVF